MMGVIPRTAKRFASWDWFALALVIVASFALRWYRIDDALVGYHVFNEGYYTELGRQYLAHGVLAPFASPLDPNNPPLYAFVLRLVFGVFGASLAAARAVSVLASTATVVAVFLLGRELYGRAAGLVAATVFGLSPGAVLVGGNAQIEGLLILLRVSAVLAYVRAVKTRDARYSALSGLLLGLAVLAKLPALVVLPGLAIWETWGSRGLKWLKTTRTRVFTLAFLFTAAPWFLVRAFTDTAWRTSQAGLIGTLELPTLETLGIWFGSELFWLVSPLVFFAFIFSLVLLVVRRRTADVLVLSLLGVNFAFYLLFSYHTYYLLPAVPMVAVSVGALAQHAGFRAAPRTLCLVLVLALVLSVSAAIVAGGKKWGGWYSSDVRDIVVRAGYAPDDIVLAVDSEILGSWEPAIKAAFPDTVVVPYPEGVSGLSAQRPVLRLAWHEEVGLESDPSTVPHRMRGPVFFGHTVQMPATVAVHHFGVVEPRLVRVGPWWWFGMVDTTGPTRLRVEVVRP